MFKLVVDGGVVDQHIQPSGSFQGCVQQRSHGFGIGDVDGQTQGAAAQRLGQRLAGGFVPIRRDHPSAGFGQGLAMLPPQQADGAGDDGGASA